VIQEKEMRWVRHVALKAEMNRSGLVETAEVKRPLPDFQLVMEGRYYNGV
jgi:hypothetical protein